VGKGSKRSKIEIELNRYSKNYKSWGNVYCPALKTKVFFTKKGWEHLFVGKRRSRAEVLERVRLLPFAKKLLEITTTVQNKRFQNFHQHYTFTAFTEGTKGTKIEVVVVEDRKKIYFLSVYKV
jgi:hypothetical protein